MIRSAAPFSPNGSRAGLRRVGWIFCGGVLAPMLIGIAVVVTAKLPRTPIAKLVLGVIRYNDLSSEVAGSYARSWRVLSVQKLHVQ